MSLRDLDFCEQSMVPRDQCTGCRQSVGGVETADPRSTGPNPPVLRRPEGSNPQPSGPSFPSPSGHLSSPLNAPAGGAHQAAASGAEGVRSMDCEGLDYARGWLDEDDQ